jgi:hypothetical protein
LAGRDVAEAFGACAAGGIQNEYESKKKRRKAFAAKADNQEEQR